MDPGRSENRSSRGTSGTLSDENLTACANRQHTVLLPRVLVSDRREGATSRGAGSLGRLLRLRRQRSVAHPTPDERIRIGSGLTKRLRQLCDGVPAVTHVDDPGASSNFAALGCLTIFQFSEGTGLVIPQGRFCQEWRGSRPLIQPTRIGRWDGWPWLGWPSAAVVCGRPPHLFVVRRLGFQ